MPLTDLARSLNLNELPTQEALSTLVKENVKTQVEHLKQTKTIQDAWVRGEDVSIHGLVYDLSAGRLSDLGVTEKGPGN